jgi:hypothetical protein
MGLRLDRVDPGVDVHRLAELACRDLLGIVLRHLLDPSKSPTKRGQGLHGAGLKPRLLARCFDAEQLREDERDGDLVEITKLLFDLLVPRVLLAANLLFIDEEDVLILVGVAALSSAIPNKRFGPELIAIPDDAGDVDRAVLTARDGPVPPVAGRISEVAPLGLIVPKKTH